MELNREQIIKGLECCTRGRGENGEIPCTDCPYEECNVVGGTDERQTKGSCDFWLKTDALALVRELTEENERLGERTERYLENLKAVLDERSERNIASDTVREMAERLKSRQVSYGNISFRVVPIDDIDQIEKEMLEETK